MSTPTNPTTPARIQTNRPSAYKALRLATAVALTFFAAISPSHAYPANKDMVQLQTQIQELQDAVARLQQSNDERMGVMKDLVQQSADSVNKMATTIDTLQRQMQTQQEAQNAKVRTGLRPDPIAQ